MSQNIWEPGDCATGGGGGTGFDTEAVVLCDVLPDGTVVGSAIAVYEYDEATGAPVGPPTFVIPGTNDPYVVQGTLQPCGDAACMDPVQFCFTSDSVVDKQGRIYDVDIPLAPGFAIEAIVKDLVATPIGLVWDVLDTDASQFISDFQIAVQSQFPGQTVDVSAPIPAECGQPATFHVHIECLRLDQAPPTLLQFRYNSGRDLIQNPGFTTEPPTAVSDPVAYVKRTDAFAPTGTKDVDCTNVLDRGWETNDNSGVFELWGPPGSPQNLFEGTTPTPRGTAVQEINAFGSGPTPVAGTQAGNPDFGQNPDTLWQTFAVPADGNFTIRVVVGGRAGTENIPIKLSTGDAGATGTGDIINTSVNAVKVTTEGGTAAGAWTTFTQTVPLAAGTYTLAFTGPTQQDVPGGNNGFGGLFTDMRVFQDAPNTVVSAATDDDTCTVSVVESETVCEFWVPKCGNGKIIEWTDPSTDTTLSNDDFWAQIPAPECCPTGSSTGGTASPGNLVDSYIVCGIVGGVPTPLQRVLITDQDGGIIGETFVGPEGQPVTPDSYTIGDCPEVPCDDTECQVLCDYGTTGAGFPGTQPVPSEASVTDAGTNIPGVITVLNGTPLFSTGAQTIPATPPPGSGQNLSGVRGVLSTPTTPVGFPNCGGDPITFTMSFDWELVGPDGAIDNSMGLFFYNVDSPTYNGIPAPFAPAGATGHVEASWTATQADLNSGIAQFAIFMETSQDNTTKSWDLSNFAISAEYAPGECAGSAAPTQFLRCVTRDCTGGIVSVIDTDLDGLTPYAVIGPVGVCSLPEVSEVVVCADGVNAIRRESVDINGTVTTEFIGADGALLTPVAWTVGACNGPDTQSIELCDVVFNPVGSTPANPRLVVDPDDAMWEGSAFSVPPSFGWQRLTFRQEEQKFWDRKTGVQGALRFPVSTAPYANPGVRTSLYAAAGIQVDEHTDCTFATVDLSVDISVRNMDPVNAATNTTPFTAFVYNKRTDANLTTLGWTAADLPAGAASPGTTKTLTRLNIPVSDLPDIRIVLLDAAGRPATAAQIGVPLEVRMSNLVATFDGVCTTTPFVRTLRYNPDGTPAVPPFSDVTRDGVAYTPTGTVGKCSEPTTDCGQYVTLCDFLSKDTELAENGNFNGFTTQGLNPWIATNGAVYDGAIVGADGTLGAVRFPNDITGQIQELLGNSFVLGKKYRAKARFGVDSRPGDTATTLRGQLQITSVVQGINTLVNTGDLTGYVLGGGVQWPSTGVVELTFTASANSGTVNITNQSLGVNPNADLLVDLISITPAEDTCGTFLRRFDCDGSYTDTSVYGETYVVAGVAVECSLCPVTDCGDVVGEVCFVPPQRTARTLTDDWAGSVRTGNAAPGAGTWANPSFANTGIRVTLNQTEAQGSLNGGVAVNLQASGAAPNRNVLDLGGTRVNVSVTFNAFGSLQSENLRNITPAFTSITGAGTAVLGNTGVDPTTPDGVITLTWAGPLTGISFDYDTLLGLSTLGVITFTEVIDASEVGQATVFRDCKTGSLKYVDVRTGNTIVPGVNGVALVDCDTDVQNDLLAILAAVQANNPASSTSSIDATLDRLTGAGTIPVAAGARSVTATVLTGPVTLNLGSGAVILPTGFSGTWAVDGPGEALTDAFTFNGGVGSDFVVQTTRKI